MAQINLYSKQIILHKVFSGSLNNVTISIIKDVSARTISSRKSRSFLPMLMESPQIVWPSPVNILKNYLKVNFIIKSCFEADFSIQDFTEASKYAVQVVSHALEDEDYELLQEYIEQPLLRKLQQIVSKLPESQRQFLSVHQGDIYYAFPYKIDIITNEKKDRFWVEILMVYFTMRRNELLMKHMQECIIRGMPPFNSSFQPHLNRNMYVLNYRFVREFTKGTQEDWWIDIVNHFKPYST